MKAIATYLQKILAESKTASLALISGSVLLLIPGAFGQAPAPNDDIDHATPVVFAPQTNTVDGAATRANDDPADCLQTGATAWFSYTPTEDTFLHVYTLGVLFNGGIAGYVGSRGSLRPLFCYAGGDWVLIARAGQTYYIMVGDESATSLQFGFLLVKSPLLKVGVTVDSIGAVDPRTGLVTISGTVTSSMPTTISLSGTVRQKLGRKNVIIGAFGGEDSPVWIDNHDQASWSAQVVGTDSSFGNGEALVTVTAQASEGFQSASAQTLDATRLRSSKSHPR